MVLANVVRMGLEVSESQIDGGLHTPRSLFRQSSALPALGRTSLHIKNRNNKKEINTTIRLWKLVNFESSKHAKISSITIQYADDTSVVFIEK
jgi:hypothetical protein